MKGDYRPAHLHQRALGEQAQVRRYLVIAAAPGVQPPPDVAGYFSDPALDGGVDVLVAGFEDERALGDLLLDGAQGGQQRPGFLF